MYIIKYIASRLYLWSIHHIRCLCQQEAEAERVNLVEVYPLLRAISSHRRQVGEVIRAPSLPTFVYHIKFFSSACYRPSNSQLTQTSLVILRRERFRPYIKECPGNHILPEHRINIGSIYQLHITHIYQSSRGINSEE